MHKRFLMMAFTAIYFVIGATASEKDISGAWSGTLKITPQVGSEFSIQFQNRN